MTSGICLFSERKVILLKRRHSAGGLVLFAAAMADDHHHQNKRSRNVFSAIHEEIFSPSGLHVLIVDDDTLLLAGLEKMLRQCDYNVTTSTSVSQAISLVMENKSSFDLVMSEVYFPGEDGFKILEVVGVGLGLPVIMMSMNGETDVVMRGITRGACNYLIKPIRMEEVRNLWQHVIRRHGRQYDHLVKLKDGHGDSSSNGRVADSSESTAFKDVKQGGEVIKDISGLKEARVNWTLELHQQFLNAVNESGPNKVVPKRILEIMNVPGLARDNVASHLQKYRLYLKRLCGIIPEPCPVASFRATRDEKSGGTMQIRPGGKTSAVSPLSSSGSSSGLKELPLRLELDGRNLDQATLESLEQFRSHEHEQKLAAANTGQVLPELVVAAAPAPIHVDEGSEGGPEVHGMRPSFHLRWLRRNLQGGGGHKASQVDDLAARSFKLNFVKDLHNTKTPPKTVDLPTHQPQLQNPSPTTEILEKDDAYHHEEAWPMAEYDKINEEDLLFNIFFEEDIGFPNHQINFRSFPFVASDVSEEYGATVNADNFNCQTSPE